MWYQTISSASNELSKLLRSCYSFVCFAMSRHHATANVKIFFSMQTNSKWYSFTALTNLNGSPNKKLERTKRLGVCERIYCRTKSQSHLGFRIEISTAMCWCNSKQIFSELISASLHHEAILTHLEINEMWRLKSECDGIYFIIRSRHREFFEKQITAHN